MLNLFLTDDFDIQEIKNEHLCITIGVFDGIHKGHEAVLTSLVDYAQQQKIKSCVITFDKNPKDVFYVEHQQMIITNEDKYEILNRLGIDYVIVLKFTPEIKRKSGKEFINIIEKNIIIDKYFLGSDFSCGAKDNNLTAADLKKKFADKVEIIPLVEKNGVKISSTLIREEIKKNKGILTDKIKKAFFDFL